MTTAALGEIASFVRGVTFKPSDVSDSGVGVMRTKNVQQTLELGDIMRIPASLVKREDQYISEGDTLVSSANSWYAVGKGCWVPQLTEPLAIGGFVTALRPSSDAVYPRYLYRWFTAPVTQATLRSFSNKTTNISNLNLKLAAEIEVPLPPLAEQRRIAAILDHADALRAKRRQILAHLDSLTKSIFHDMFGDPLRNGRGLPRSAIGSVAAVVTGNSPSRAEATNFGDEIEWIKSDNLGGVVATRSEEWLSESGRAKARVAPTGSVLVTCIAGSRTSIGKASLVDRDVAFNQQINAVLPSDALEPLFLLAQLKAAPELVRAKSTGGMKGLVNKSSFQSIEILLPSPDDQRKFARCARQVDHQRLNVEPALVADDQLFHSLQSRAFRGDL